MDMLQQRQEAVTRAAAFDLPFFVYITTASCIAAAGLVMDSSEVIVASMLISPIMNHATAVAFGVALRDRNLVMKGMLGIGMGAAVGAIVGAMAGVYFGATMVVTNEMLTRTTVLNMQWSLVVAFFSAVAAGVSILHEQAGNLIGVSISTSVLPPIVNFGVLLPRTFWRHPNATSMHACLVSMGIAMGNVLIIVITAALIILTYARFPAAFEGRRRDRRDDNVVTEIHVLDN